jgi:hypothetical protein
MSAVKSFLDAGINVTQTSDYPPGPFEPMMALHVHGEISRNAGHAHETIAISRIQAARIHLMFGHMYDAARCAFNAHAHAMIAKQVELAVESGAIFVEISAGFIDDEADKFADQIIDSKPPTIEESTPTLQVHSDDINGVLEWCIEHTHEGYSGQERPDLRALMLLTKKLERTELFSELLSSPNEVEDAMLAALCASVSVGDQASLWTQRVTDIMTLKEA